VVEQVELLLAAQAELGQTSAVAAGVPL